MRSRSTRTSRNAQRLRFDVHTQARCELAQRHHVNATVQQRLEIVGEVEEGRERDPVRIELDDQVDVAGLGRLATDPNTASSRTP